MHPLVNFLSTNKFPTFPFLLRRTNSSDPTDPTRLEMEFPVYFSSAFHFEDHLLQQQQRQQQRYYPHDQSGALVLMIQRAATLRCIYDCNLLISQMSFLRSKEHYLVVRRAKTINAAMLRLVQQSRAQTELEELSMIAYELRRWLENF